VNAARLHVLVDLSGHNRGGRPGVTARRPAAAVAVYPDLPGTSGLPAGLPAFFVADRRAPLPSESFFRVAPSLSGPGVFLPGDAVRVAGSAPCDALLQDATETGRCIMIGAHKARAWPHDSIIALYIITIYSAIYILLYIALYASRGLLGRCGSVGLSRCYGT
jgi:hypothetical protein